MPLRFRHTMRKVRVGCGTSWIHQVGTPAALSLWVQELLWVMRWSTTHVLYSVETTIMTRSKLKRITWGNVKGNSQQCIKME